MYSPLSGCPVEIGLLQRFAGDLASTQSSQSEPNKTSADSTRHEKHSYIPRPAFLTCKAAMRLSRTCLVAFKTREQKTTLREPMHDVGLAFSPTKSPALPTDAYRLGKRERTIFKLRLSNASRPCVQCDGYLQSASSEVLSKASQSLWQTPCIASKSCRSSDPYLMQSKA